MKKKTQGAPAPNYVKWLWYAALTPFVLLAAMLTLTALGAFGRMPSFEELENPRSNIATEIYSEDGKVLGTFFVQNRSYVQYEELFASDSVTRTSINGREVPPIVAALIATEDARFDSHSGIDIPSLIRVGVKTILLQNRSAGGGSTITQQLAKNLFPRDTVRRQSALLRKGKLVLAKFKEWITALKLEYNYTKEEIAAMYLNIVEYGSNAYGIKSAAHTFFNKTPDQLNLQEAAVLVGVVNAPTRYSPVRNYDNAMARRNLVLARMAEAGAITHAERDSLSALPITLNYRPVSHNDGQATYFREMLRQVMNARPPKRRNFYTEWDYEQAVKEYENNPIYGWCHKNTKADGTPYNIYKDGLKIYTTINSTMQQYAEEAMLKQLRTVIQPKMDAQYRSTKVLFQNTSAEEREKIVRQAMRYSDRYRALKEEGRSEAEIDRIFRTPCPTRVFTYRGERDTILSPRDSILHHKRIMRAGFVAIEPQTGRVKAYVGGPNFRYFKYDMAKQGKRQIGSTIKPFVYTFAIDHLGLTPCTPVPNLPVTIDTSNGTPWRNAPPEMGVGAQPQQLLGVDHEAGQTARGGGRLHPQHGHPLVHRSGLRALSGHLRIERLRDGERLLDLRQRRRAYRPDLRNAHRRPAGQPDRHLHSRIAGRRIGAHGLHDAHDAAKRRDERNGRPAEMAVRSGRRPVGRQDRHLAAQPRRVVHVRGPEAGGGRMGRRRRPVGAPDLRRRGQHHGPADRGRILLDRLQESGARHLQAGPVPPPRPRDGVRLRGGDAAVAVHGGGRGILRLIPPRTTFRSMTIRAPKPEDAAAVAALYNHYVLHSTASFETEPLDAEQMRSRLESATARLVCEREGAIVGFGYTHDWKERAAYRHTQEVTVYVASDSTGLGIGRRLVERLVAECRTTECHALVACITADNEPSRRLFESIGFRRVSHFEQVGRKFGRWLDVVDYELLL